MMDSEYIIHSYSDTLYSCLMPHEKQFEYRMPNHSIIYVRSGELTVEQKGTEVTMLQFAPSGIILEKKENKCSEQKASVLLGNVAEIGGMGESR